MFQKKGVGTRRLKYRISRGFAARDGSAVKSHSTIGSLRNEDDDGYEDFHLKIQVRVIHITTKLFHVVSR